MKRLPIILLAVLLATCTEPVVDTFGNIGGTVSDADTGLPLAGVSVGLTPTGYSQVTNANGTFQFDNLDVQEYTLTFKKSGYETYQHKVTVKPGLSSSVQINLRPADLAKPIVSEHKAMSITSSSFNLYALLQSVGSSAVTSHGFCYSTQPGPTTASESIELGQATQPKSFSAKVEGLKASTTYYCRAYAQNASGLVYSEEIMVSTLAPGGNGSGEGDGIAVSSGLMLYYTFDNGDCSDASDMEIDGQAIGSPSFLDGNTPSGTGKCIFLNGTKGQYINIPYCLFDGYTAYSISVWLKDFSTGSIVSGVSSGNYYNYPRLHFNSDGKMALQTEYGYGGQIENSQNYHFIYPCASLQSGEWHHIVVTCNKSSQKLYIDGTLVDTKSDNCHYENSYSTYATKVQIGGNGDGVFSVSFSGKLDNVRLYGKELSKQDVKDIYNAEK